MFTMTMCIVCVLLMIFCCGGFCFIPHFPVGSFSLFLQNIFDGMMYDLLYDFDYIQDNENVYTLDLK